MKEIKLKPNKHLLIFQIPAGFSPGQVEALSIKFKHILGDEFKFMISQPETEISLLSIED